MKMVKCVRGRTITVHLTTDTAARCHIEQRLKVYRPVLIILSNHVGTCSPGCSDHATPAQHAAIRPLMMSDTARDEMIFATESFSKRRLRNVTKVTGTLAANVASDTSIKITTKTTRYSERYVHTKVCKAIITQVNETSPGTLD